MKEKNDYRLVTVCDHCLQASCWRGQFYCDNYRNAGITKIPLWALERLALEHSDYWEINPDYPEGD